MVRLTRRAKPQKQFLNAPPLEAGQSQLSEGTRKMAPNEQDIASFLEIGAGQVTRETAILFLESVGGNYEQAVMAFWDNPDKFSASYQATHWNEAQFGADRDGGSGTTADNVPSFSIDVGADQGIGATSAAPTRPPSRRSNYSTRSAQQENGTINSLGHDVSGRAYFGPAKRDAYVPAEWAMVVSSSSRVYENPEAEERRRDRENGEPVFFKPLKEKDPLPSLLATLGQIPRTRKELLCEGLELEHYGSNTRWWDGEDAHAGEASLVEERINQEDVIAETQRLVAFMQESQRSYGSVEQLERLPFLNNDTANEIMESSNMDYSGDVRFLLGWTSAAGLYTGEAPQSLFKSVATERRREMDEADEEQIGLYRLELETAVSEPKRTLYQAIDDMFFVNDRNGDTDNESFLDQVATIFTIRVKNRHTNDDARGLGLQVPATFCADRYLQANVKPMKEMRRRRAKLREDMGAISARKAALDKVPNPKKENQLLNREELFDKTIKFLRARHESGVKAEKNEPDGDVEMSESSRTNWGQVADALEKEHEKIKNKLKDLDAQRTRIEQQIANLSNVFTESDSDHPELETRYTLRGVGIGPAYETTFVYVDPEPSTDDTSMDSDGQWWRFEFPSSGNFNKPSTKKVTEEEVLNEASNEATEALLIYAEKAACNPEDPEIVVSALPDALETFIDADNGAFAAELEQRRADLQAVDAAWMEDANDDRPALPPRNSSLEEPPAYSATEHLEHIPDLKVEPPEEDTWVPDPGPGVLSDAEYAANVQYKYGQGRGVSTMMEPEHPPPPPPRDGANPSNRKDDTQYGIW